MIEIRYFSTVPDYNNNFDILFCLRDYIPDEFFQQHEEGAGAELYFFISLFYKSGILDCKKEHYHDLVLDYAYDCFFNGIHFLMIYDEAYDIVSFHVEPENKMHVTDIAEEIKRLIETDGMNTPLIKKKQNSRKTENIK